MGRNINCRIMTRLPFELQCELSHFPAPRESPAQIRPWASPLDAIIFGRRDTSKRSTRRTGVNRPQMTIKPLDEPEFQTVGY